MKLLTALTLTALLASPLSAWEDGGFRIAGFNQVKQQGQIQTNLDLPESDPAGTDLLRFTNGDIMHGEFRGLNDGVIWNRPDIGQPIRFQLNNIRQVIFKGGQNLAATPDQAYVSLISGDQIPGKIISLDDKELLLDSPLTGQLRIARDQIKSLTPNPFDGNLLYAGPFTSNGWIMADRIKPEEEKKREREADQPVAPADAKEAPADNGKDKEEKEKELPPPPWIYSGAAFYSTGQFPLLRQANLPDVGRLRFRASWKNRLNISIAFHADFKRPLPPEPKEEVAKVAEDAEPKTEEDTPEAAEEEPKEPAPLKFETISDHVKGDTFQAVEWMANNGGSGNHALTYGSAYVLTLYSSYPTLNRASFSPDGQPQVTSLRATRANISLAETGEADFDLRFDRNKSTVYLYVDGQYFAQWNDLDGYAGKGGGIGFGANSNCRLKISDVLVTSWNGTPDAARSLVHDERDIALLTNGTDRFSGQVSSIKDGKVAFKGPFADMTIPLADLSELQFSTSTLADPDELDWDSGTGIMRFNPFGKISLSPIASDEKSLSGKSPILGDLKINLDSAILLQFADGPDALDEWITDF
ncbi:MAG: hypothetical protein ACSHYF_03235 [Verrucomicrobiaceae bacterium]